MTLLHHLIWIKVIIGVLIFCLLAEKFSKVQKVVKYSKKTFLLFSNGLEQKVACSEMQFIVACCSPPTCALYSWLHTGNTCGPQCPLYSAPREYMGTVQRHCTRAPAPAAAQRIAGTGAPSAAQLSSDLRTVNTSRAARQSCYQHTHSPSPDSKQVNW